MLFGRYSSLELKLGRSCERWFSKVNVKPKEREIKYRDKLVDKLRGERPDQGIREKEMIPAKQDTSTLNPKQIIWMRSITSCNDTTEALSLVEKMKALNIQPHLPIYNNVMNIASNNRDLTKCKELLDSIIKVGLKPNMITLGTLLKAAKRVHNFDFAQSVWHQLVTKGDIKPSFIQYNIMISCCAELRENRFGECLPWERVIQANQLFEDMLKNKIAPTVVSFGALLHVYAKSHYWQGAEELVTRVMPKHGVEFDKVTSTTLINAYNRAGQFEKSVEHFNIACTHFEINEALWCSAMFAFKQLNCHDDVKRLWYELCENKLNTHVSECVYASSLARAGLTDELQNLALDEIGWKAVINELWEEGKFETASQLFLRAYEDGKLPVCSEFKKHYLDLRGHNLAVASCAISHFLSIRTDNRQEDPLGIVVGNSKQSTSAKSLGGKIRQMLQNRQIRFSETAKGDTLLISREEIRRQILLSMKAKLNK